MLVLTRKKGERVMIGDDIVVTIIDVRGDGVRIGFDAPRGVSIQRAEVLAAVSAANTAAAKAPASDGELLLGMLGSGSAVAPGAAAPAPSTPTADSAAPSPAAAERRATPSAPPVPSAPTD
ncbi:carbon storage regulator CsrA [Naasia lichenicola]|uniref:Translational regulator CsrA n=1 Tax=Naasia lichenicola TaxID=2565933 RepID=A0A4S4FIM1_9MICO|nr:carbon storage regulator [Naasia lichenicola]